MAARHLRSGALAAALGALALEGCAGRRPAPTPVAADAPPPPAASPVPATAGPPAKSPAPRAAAGAKRRTGAPRPRSRSRADSAALERALVARRAHAPLARVLVRRNATPEVADRIAAAVVRESRRLRLSPSLVAGVLLVENRALDTAAVSGAGAVGLMQVMPLHAGGWGCRSANLREVDANICHGARILHRDVRRSATLATALRRYNGCVASAATPRCRRYPSKVLAAAGRIRREMLLADATRRGAATAMARAGG
ncbi:MAG TPA: transglycosylase SLT domain-containing protein [Gemmatimonadales bacterium]|nr:transglycosylase SLT domain-containing protein [Gemmatimonadales bacterium]